MKPDALELSRELAEQLGQLPYFEPPGSFFIKSRSTAGVVYRVDVFPSGLVYCDCPGFQARRHCYHSDAAKETYLAMNDTPGTAIEVSRDREIDAYSPGRTRDRLAALKQESAVIAEFMRDVMVVDTDYGVVPGVDRPFLFKAGAEKLLELYGYAPTIKSDIETVDEETGWLRVVTTVQLVQRGTGLVIGEGVGECNTKESRYTFRWVGDRNIPEGVDVSTLKKRHVGKGAGWDQWRIPTEPEDLFALWNTVRKMSKKRALVDATLAATRSSGVFMQDSTAKIDEWIEGEIRDLGEDEEVAAPAKPAAEPVKAGARSSTPQEAATAAAGSAPAEERVKQRNAITSGLEDLRDNYRPTYDEAKEVLKTAYGHAFDEHNRFYVVKLTDDELAPALATVSQLVDRANGRPAADAAPAEAEQAAAFAD